MIRPLLKVCGLVGVLLTAGLSSHAALQHRYSFAADASDSVGGAHGVLVADAAVIGGAVVLDGTDDMVELPGPTIAINTFPELTLELWASSSTAVQGNSFTVTFGDTWSTTQFGKDYIGIFTRVPTNPRGVIANTPDDAAPWSDEIGVSGPVSADEEEHLYTLTVDDADIAFYRDGVLLQRSSLAGPTSSGETNLSLSGVANVLALLGGSPYGGDGEWAGSINEFRIHDTALSGLEVAVNVGLGADDANGNPGTVSTSAVRVEDTVIDGTKQATLELTYSIAGVIELNSDPNLIWSSSDTNIISVTQNGVITGHAPGSVTLTATLNGTPTTATVSVGGTILRHQYSFNGALQQGTFLEPDVAGTADATVVNAERLGDGTVRVDTAVTNGYVDLPNGIISALSSATFEIWVTPEAPAGEAFGWERIWSFGTTTEGEITPDNPSTTYNGAQYLRLVARRGTEWFLTSDRQNGEPNLWSVPPQRNYTPGQQLHVAVSLNSATQESALYVNGVLVNRDDGVTALSSLSDVNNWLGRSQYNADSYLNGRFNEFRIWEGVKSARELGISAQLGPDGLSSSPGAVSTREILADDSVVIDGVKGARLSLRYANLVDAVAFTSDPGLSWSSSDTNILTVTEDGVMTGVSIGTVTLTASFDGQDATRLIEVTDRSLKHRYTFNGPLEFFEYTEPDVVSGADGTVYDPWERNGAGQLELSPNQGYIGYVDLPNGTISALGSATFEAWLTPRDLSGLNYQRIFDFGAAQGVSVNDDGELSAWDAATGFTGAQTRSLFLTARVAATASPKGELLFVHEENGAAGTFSRIDGPRYTLGEPIHVALTYNTAAGETVLYLNGIPVGSAATTGRLDQLHDVNNWLGHSQWDGDGFLDGLYDEFRIYAGVLTAEEIAGDYAAGPDGDPFPELGTNITAIAVTADNTELLVDFGGAQVTATADFAGGLSGVPINGLDGIVFSSTDTNVLRVSASGFVEGLSPGGASVWVQYQGFSNSVAFTVNSVVKPTTLMHRWSFNETSGTTVMDSVGTADGTVIGTNHAWTSSELDLFGGGAGADANPTSTVENVGSYVDLPNGMISALSNAATFEVWFTYDGLGNSIWWQRVWDFGSSQGGEDISDLGGDYLFLTPYAGADVGIRTAVCPNWGVDPEVPQLNAGTVYQNQEVHVVFLHDTDDGFARLYINGQLVDSGEAVNPLSALNDVNNWLGRAQFNDPMLDGRLNELRIYNGLLNSAEIQDHFAWGPDNLTAPVSVRLDASANGNVLSLTWPSSTPATVQATTDLSGSGTWSDVGGSPVVTNGVYRQDVPMNQDVESFRLTD